MTARDLIALPKAHLHLHFTGSMRPETLVDLADKYGLSLPPPLRSRPMLHLSADQRGWFRFQRMYDIARSCVRSAEDMQRLVFEAAHDDAAEGSRWLELQVDPSGYAHHVGGLTAALEIVLDAAWAATMQTGTHVAIIVAASRIRHPLDARILARLAARYAGQGAGNVVGFGLSNDERRADTADFQPAFDIARRAGLALMPHSGELLGPDHVRYTLSCLNPHRLGHGVRAAEDSHLLHEVVNRGIGLEVCPTSNVSLGVYPTLDRVPLRALMDAGAKIALGADDPLLFGPRLVDQYQAARDHHDCSDAELAKLAAMSFEISCAPPDLVSDWHTQIDAWLASSTGG